MVTHVSEQARRRNGFFEDLMELLIVYLKENGVPDPGDKAEEIALEILKKWGGVSLNIPKKPDFYFGKIKEQAVSEYTGNNILEITRKYNISENLFYRWLNEKLKEYKEQAEKNQGRLDI